MAEKYETRYFSGQGNLKIGQRDANGEPMGLEFIGDVASVTLTPSIEKETIVENVSGSSGTGAEYIKKVEYQFSMQMRSFKPEHISLALHASNTAKASGSVTNEPHKGYKGKFIVLKHIKISTVVVTNVDASTTYVAGTDYLVDANAGQLEILAAGAITDAQDLLVDYAYAAQHHLSAAPSNKYFYLVFDGINRADDGKKVRCEIFRLKLSPSALGMIEDKSAEMPVTGTVALDANRPVGEQFYSWKIED